MLEMKAKFCCQFDMIFLNRGIEVLEGGGRPLLRSLKIICVSDVESL